MDGQPRALHLQESLASIHFTDFEPALIRSEVSRHPAVAIRHLVNDSLFRVDACRVIRRQPFDLHSDRAQILGVLTGTLRLTCPPHALTLNAGQFVLLPAVLEGVALTADRETEYLHVQSG